MSLAAIACLTRGYISTLVVFGGCTTNIRVVCMYFIFQLCGCFVSYVVCGVCACHSPLIYGYNNLFKTNEKP